MVRPGKMDPLSCCTQQLATGVWQSKTDEQAAALVLRPLGLLRVSGLIEKLRKAWVLFLKK